MNIMMSNIIKTEAEQNYSDHFHSVHNKLPGCDQMKALRSQAFDRFEQTGLPNRRVEEWKYTDLRARLKKAFPVEGDQATSVTHEDISAALAALADIDAKKAVFVNGQFSTALSDPLDAQNGVEVLTLTEAFDITPDWFAKEINQVAVFDTQDVISNLNTAFVSDGAAIRVLDTAGNAEAQQKVHLIFVSAGASAKTNTTRYLVSVEDKAELTLLESHITVGDAKAQNNAVCELIVGAEAEVDHIKCQLDATDTTHLSTWMVRIDEKAHYRAFQMSSGSEFSRNQILVRFQGEYAQAHIGGVFLGKGAQHCDNTLIVDHAVPHCSSQELFKLVLDDDARGVFQGKLEVKPDAQKTDAKQMAQALLLSEKAEFDAKPELEIFADDVVCGHGATSGQIDEELMFYLRARGISEEQAKSLLIAAFIGEAFEMVQDDGIRDGLTGLAQDWLEKL